MKRSWPKSSLVLVALSLAAGDVQAEEFRYWVGDTGWWNDSANWSLTDGGPGGAGQPLVGDYVLLKSEDSNKEIYYYNTLNPDAVLGTIRIFSTGSGTMTLNQGHDGYAHSLYAVDEYIGSSGIGNYIQSAGRNTVNDILNIGQWGTGSYELSGSGVLSAGVEVIGEYGTGTFTQGGGSNTVSSNLLVGYDSGGMGSYDLAGGDLSVGTEYIGFYNIGSFVQSGGNHQVTNDLTLGYSSLYGEGSYELSGSGILSADTEVVGGHGTGSFTQSGGSNTVTNNLVLGDGAGGSGTYTLADGALEVGGVISIADADDSSAEFNLAGGQLTAGAIVVNESGVFSFKGGTVSAGDFSQEAGGTLAFEIGSGLLLYVDDTATLGGTLELDLLAGFTPSLGDTFDILSADTIFGEFDFIDYVLFGDKLGWDVSYILDDSGLDIVRLTAAAAVPAPTSQLLIGAGLSGLIGLRRKRPTG